MYSLFIWNWYLNECLSFLFAKSSNSTRVAIIKANSFLWSLSSCVGDLPDLSDFVLLLSPSLWLFPNRSDTFTSEPLFWLLFLPISYLNHLFITANHLPHSISDLVIHFYLFFRSTHLPLACIFIGFIVYYLPFFTRKRALQMQEFMFSITLQPPRKVPGT